MSIYDFDNDFAHYEANEETQKAFGMVWTPYIVIEKMMDKAGLVSDKFSIWYDETKTNFDPTMGAGNIVIAMLYRRIVECGQGKDPVIILSNVYGVELDKDTLEYAKNRIKKFMKTVETKFNMSFDWNKIEKIINHNFVCSDIFEWDIENWKPKIKSLGDFEQFLNNI